jgi:hypothetical protein
MRGGIHARGEDSTVDDNGQRSAAEADPGAAAAVAAATERIRIERAPKQNRLIWIPPQFVPIHKVVAAVEEALVLHVLWETREVK